MPDHDVTDAGRKAQEIRELQDHYDQAIAKIAELERARESRDRFMEKMATRANKLREQRDALQQQIAALRADGDRLDWLESQVDRDKQALNNGCFQQTIQVFGNRTLRQAIDSARAAAGEEKGK